jgi:hypothetical protein
MKKYSVIAVFFFFSFSLFARDVTIFVKDFDLDIPLEGASIRSWDGTVFVCDADGKAVIQAADRQVVIQASYPGYETSRLVIPVRGDSFTVRLHLSGVMQGRELVIEESRPGTSESRTGRSVALDAREIAQSAEIGVIEDVMTAIKLLPGVTYNGYYNSQPSIRGGHPGEMIASLDGYYITSPYHWGGGFSIFDPRMVQSAQLSHGVFSSRFGNTISGLLDITSKKPSPTETEFELGVNTSTANFNLSIPFAGKGGVLLLGRITYYDPVIFLAKQAASFYPELEVINSVKTAPYIRSGTITGNYRFTQNLEFSATGFWGMDGVGVKYVNSSRTSSLDSDTSMDFVFTNYQGFFTTSLAWNPRSDMLVKLTAGTGYTDVIIDGDITYDIYNKEFSKFFMDNYYPSLTSSPLITGNKYQYHSAMQIEQSSFLFNLQGRLDYDWEISDKFLISLGVQEIFNRFKSSGDQKIALDTDFSNLDNTTQLFIKNNIGLYIWSIPANSPIWDNLKINVPMELTLDSQNDLFSTSAYILGELNFNRFKAEAGLRLDHFFLRGKDFTIKSTPVLNPRLNIDFNILKNVSFLKTFDISAGTGLFSSVNDIVSIAEAKYGIDYMKPNRSWTSILGFKMEFPDSFILNIEGYYKYIFNRMYVPVALEIGEPGISPEFDGVGKVWGLDIMLQKLQGRFWHGWLTYSFNWAKYRDPQGETGNLGISGGSSGGEWYYPSFHRFHNLNLVLNIKPIPTLNIYIRFGIASGTPTTRRVGSRPESYPLLIFDENDPSKSYIIEKYYWRTVSDPSYRSPLSLPMDLKFSIFGNNANGKVRYELYFALENILSFVNQMNRPSTFNSYTGEIDTGSTAAAYNLPIPIPSFGFKISY